MTRRSALRVDPASAAAPDPARIRAAPRRRTLNLDELVAGVRDGDHAILGRAITLVESNHPNHLANAQQLLAQLMPHTGTARRIGITGVPGVGKSTFIDALGMHLTDAGHKVAVLAVDPSSTVTGGSILGDKTRMARLSVAPGAFIRPSPSGGALGGVARKTRETLLLCEAAGYDVVLVETVGVGQSETMVADMTDSFLALMLAGAGDELQGIKRGLLERVDVLAINKADGDNRDHARRAASEYQNALHYMPSSHPDWKIPVLTCSAREDEGLDTLWKNLEHHRAIMTQSDAFATRRRKQLSQWMWAMVNEQLQQSLRQHPKVKTLCQQLERQVTDGQCPPTLAAQKILEAFGS